MVRLLLAYKANLTLPDLRGYNALHLAVLWGQSEIFGERPLPLLFTPQNSDHDFIYSLGPIETLLQARASVEQRTKNSQNLFHLLPLSTLSPTAIATCFQSQPDHVVSYLLNQPETEGEYVMTPHARKTKMTTLTWWASCVAPVIHTDGLRCM